VSIDVSWPMSGRRASFQSSSDASFPFYDPLSRKNDISGYDIDNQSNGQNSEYPAGDTGAPTLFAIIQEGIDEESFSGEGDVGHANVHGQHDE